MRSEESPNALPDGSGLRRGKAPDQAEEWAEHLKQTGERQRGLRRGADASLDLHAASEHDPVLEQRGLPETGITDEDQDTCAQAGAGVREEPLDRVDLSVATAKWPSDGTASIRGRSPIHQRPPVSGVGRLADTCRTEAYRSGHRPRSPHTVRARPFHDVTRNGAERWATLSLAGAGTSTTSTHVDVPAKANR